MLACFVPFLIFQICRQTNVCRSVVNNRRISFCSISRQYASSIMAGILSAAGVASPRMREYGHWSEVVSSAGKVYYYNRVTEKSQWIKPDGWEKAESIIFPVLDRLQSREASGFSDNVQTDCMSDDDMDVSYGDSPAPSTSPDSSIEGRPQSSKENREERMDDMMDMESHIDKYYRAGLVASLHEKFQTERMRSTQALRSSCAFEIEFAAQQTQMYRARTLARTAMAKALESQKEVSTLSKIQKRMDESRAFFQANFESEMLRILRGPEGRTKKNKGHDVEKEVVLRTREAYQSSESS